MAMDFIDANGKPRRSAEIEDALHWAKTKIVRPDMADPAGVIHCVTIKDALQELLTLRRAAKSALATNGGFATTIPQWQDLQTMLAAQAEADNKR